MSKPWMTSEVKLLKEHWHTCLDAEAAERVGRSIKACKALAEKIKNTDPKFAEALAERDGAYREMIRNDQSIRVAERYRARRSRARSTSL